MMESYLKCEECAGNVIDKEAGILNRGNLGRLKNFLSRAAQGERLTVGFIGGSITQGFAATEPDQCYRFPVRRGESTGRPASAAAGSGICRIFRERSQYAAFLRDLRRPGEADLWQCERTGNGVDP